MIVCVHNALEEVKECLASVISAISSGDRVIVVDDGSNDETKKYLQSFSHKNKDICLLKTNSGDARGYCPSANIGMKLAERKFLLMLNSDTKITKKALNNMVQLAQSNDRVAVVGPLSNAASTQSIPEIKGSSNQTAINELPEGHTLEDINELCINWSKGSEMPSVPLVHGFCQLIRTCVAHELHGFDEESFPNGYGEENDFCFRVGNAGYDLKIATNAFVYHKKSASYSDDEVRTKLMQKGGQKLRELHGADRLAQSINIMEGHPLLVNKRCLANEYFYGGSDS